MSGPYRESTDSLRARADALELQNVILQARIRRLEGRQFTLARKSATQWLTGALALVLVVALAGTVFATCVSVVVGSAAGFGLQ